MGSRIFETGTKSAANKKETQPTSIKIVRHASNGNPSGESGHHRT